MDKYNTQSAAGGMAVYEGVNLVPNGFSYITALYTHRIVLKATANKGEYEVVTNVESGVSNSNGFPAEFDFVLVGYDGTQKSAKTLKNLAAEAGDIIVFDVDPSELAKGYVGINAYLIKK